MLDTNKCDRGNLIINRGGTVELCGNCWTTLCSHQTHRPQHHRTTAPKDHRTIGFCIRMTSCVLSLLFLVFLCPSITANSQTGVKIRITSVGLDEAKVIGVAFLEKLINKPLTEFDVEPIKDTKVTIKGLTLTELKLTPDQVVLTFQENSGIHFEIKQLGLTVELTWDNKKYTVKIENFAANIDVKLKHDQGHLALEIPKCEAKLDKFTPTTSGIAGNILTGLQGIVKFIFNQKGCSIIQKKIPEVNKKLKDFPMMISPYEGLDISLDFSLSGDLKVTKDSLDIPFKALLSRQALNNALTGSDPVFKGFANQVYVGISDLFFNSAARSLFDVGAMTLQKKLTNPVVKALVKILQLFKQPLKLLQPLSGSLEITEVPVFSISQDDGVTVSVSATGKVTPESPANSKDLVSVSVSVSCSVKLQQGTWNRAVKIFTDKFSCKPDSKTDSNKIVKAGYDLVSNVIQSLAGLEFALPDGFDLLLTDITYHQGFLTFGGSVNLSKQMRDKLLDAVLQQMSSLFQS